MNVINNKQRCICCSLWRALKRFCKEVTLSGLFFSRIILVGICKVNCGEGGDLLTRKKYLKFSLDFVYSLYL